MKNKNEQQARGKQVGENEWERKPQAEQLTRWSNIEFATRKLLIKRTLEVFHLTSNKYCHKGE